MDKQLIERIALEVAQEAEVLDADGECPKREGADITEYVLDFAHRFLARIDAERGKGAVAIVDFREQGWRDFVDSIRNLPDGTPIFRSPTIPEGMALVSLGLAEQQRILLEDAFAFKKGVQFDAFWRDLIAAQWEHTAEIYRAPLTRPTLPEGWKDKIQSDAEIGFSLAQNHGRLSDGALAIDDTQIGIEFAIEKVEAMLAAAQGEQK